VHSASAAATVLILGGSDLYKTLRLKVRPYCLRLLVFRIDRLTELFPVASRATRMLYPCSSL
jgi:hypothetical protein